MSKSEILHEYIKLRASIKNIDNKTEGNKILTKILDFQKLCEMPLLGAKLELFLEIKISEIRIMEVIKNLKYNSVFDFRL